jgi:selenocysteine lyase/cysteine desulfurase
MRVAPVDAIGQVRLDEYELLFNARTRLVSSTHVSNALGTVTPAREMVAIARRHGALSLGDGAQAVLFGVKAKASEAARAADGTFANATRVVDPKPSYA